MQTSPEDARSVSTFKLVNKGRMKELLFLYYSWCKYFSREPSDDDDFIDGLMFMEVSHDLEEDSYKRVMQRHARTTRTR